MTRMESDLVARSFGEAFAAALEKAPVGEWAGPIDSEYRRALRSCLRAHTSRDAAVGRRARPGRARVGERAPPARAKRELHEHACHLRGQHRRDTAGGSHEKALAPARDRCRCFRARCVPGHADEFKPAYLQLTQIDGDTYDVLWKIPAIDESTTLKVKPQFPAGTTALSDVGSTFARGVAVQRWRIRVPGGLDAKAVLFSHLSETRIDVLARLVRLDGSVQLERIMPASPRFVARPSPAGSKWSRHTPCWASNTS